MLIQIDERKTVILLSTCLLKLSLMFPELGQIMNGSCLGTWLSCHILT